MTVTHEPHTFRLGTLEWRLRLFLLFSRLWHVNGCRFKCAKHNSFSIIHIAPCTCKTLLENLISICRSGWCACVSVCRAVYMKRAAQFHVITFMISQNSRTSRPWLRAVIGVLSGYLATCHIQVPSTHLAHERQQQQQQQQTKLNSWQMSGGDERWRSLEKRTHCARNLLMHFFRAPAHNF